MSKSGGKNTNLIFLIAIIIVVIALIFAAFMLTRSNTEEGESTITFDPEGGTINGSYVDLVFTGTTDSDPVNVPTPYREGYNFNGWNPSTNSNTVPFTNNDQVFTARWTPIEMTITFKLAGGNINGNSSDIVLTGTINSSPANAPAQPTRSGYNFNGWNPSVGNGTIPFTTEDQTFTARWTVAIYSVTFDFDDDEQIVGFRGNAGTVIDIPDDPERYGYIFAGWQLKGEHVNFGNDRTITLNAAVNGNRYIAAWTAIETTITFKLGGGAVGQSEEDVVYQGTVKDELVDIPVPMRSGYTFERWNPSLEGMTKIWFTEDNQEYIAKWTAIETTITFKLGGGAVGQSEEDLVYHGTVESSSVEVPVPTRYGYDFVGWVPQDVFGSIGFGIENQEYTAKWEKRLVEIVFDFNGGLLNGETSMTVQGYFDSDPVTIPVPIRSGYMFTGWDPSLGGLVEVGFTDILETVYTAGWRQIPN
jgi:Listeria/Bacterioides repeat